MRIMACALSCLLLSCLLAIGAMAQSNDFRATFSLVPASQSGVDFVHTDGGTGDRYIVETVLGSLALFDYDNDGLIDIYFVNGAALPSTKTKAIATSQPTNRLYRNLGGFRFADVTVQSGLGDLSYGMGVVVGDVDEDGDADVFLSNFGRDRFYLNQADGTFTEAAQACGFSAPARFGAGNSLFDMDLDGDLDLYCATYVEFDFSKHRTRTIAGKEFNTGPNDYPPAADFLYRNNGDGSFTDVSSVAGIDAIRSPGMGVLAADFDDDGDMDVFVANDQQPNFLWINEAGKFHDEALVAGVAFDRNGKANGNMGVEYADLNGDGRLDLVTTTYQDEMPVYYEALDAGLFTDSTNLAKIDLTLNPHVKWGVGACDFDNDGDNDLFIACGHFLDNIRAIDDRTDVKVKNYLLTNNGNGVFRNVTATAGSAMQVIESSRGAAFDDLDNDGDLDMVVLNINAEATLARNDLPFATTRSLSVRLIGTHNNRDAVGSKVSLRAAPLSRSLCQVVLAGRGYESHYGSRLHFGLGAVSQTSTVLSPMIQVTWPTGQTEEFDCPIETSHTTATLIEGGGRIAKRWRVNGLNSQ